MFTYEPRNPQRRKSIRSFEKNYHLDNSLQELHIKDDMFKQQRISIDRIDRTTKYRSQDQYNYSDEQITDEDTDEWEEFPPNHSQKRSRTSSPQRIQNSFERFKKSPESHSIEQNTNNCNYLLIFLMFIAIPIIVFLVSNIKKESISKKRLHSVSNDANDVNPVLLNSIEYIRTKFRNQDSDIWNDISSGINEALTRTPKIPSIILLFANETTTMNCLAAELGRVSSAILGGDNPIYLNPEDFGDNPGEIINTLKELMPVKNAVIIYDVLNINADAIKALHNLCDRINPLIGETIYIITMKTKDYKSSHKLDFIEKQIYYELSTKIDQDILMALIVRMTDGIIISVQPEPNLQYC